jgi:Flp pilus assembly pilin Flp
MFYLLRDDQGQDLVEYALIVAAVGLALIATVNNLQLAIVSLYTSMADAMGGFRQF